MPKPKTHQIIGYCPLYKEPTSPRWLSSHCPANIRLLTKHPNISLQKNILFIFVECQTKVCKLRFYYYL